MTGRGRLGYQNLTIGVQAITSTRGNSMFCKRGRAVLLNGV